MFPIDRLSELEQVCDVGMRTWLEARMRELTEEAFEVRFWIVEPDDSVLAMCWLACWGREPDAHTNAQTLMSVVEYVEEQPTFFALVIPSHHEAGLIVIIPKSAALDVPLLDQLQHASVNLVPAVI
ncbi:hypothetical protein ThidrDRAFT_4365 [Thiorhodococcus drewsii AZ1]|uniref:Uncharacterized protein n=1 Tax=Thiorhodococcus drewsii AZ1 TaxID=765913 RepID=G2E7V2_9GAMM|nr:hypothetical protein [Thiorhodococcus drewsii]EGV27827.1 hypothetical protein ThidrDRAFT_4365 [Thiorhodococcus drewsii AZ1]